MENHHVLFERLVSGVQSLGADIASVIDANKIETDSSFRSLCSSNACGLYGKCWMCPPDIGDIEDLMATLGQYDYALIYQQIGRLEDSYDFDGMMKAKQKHYRLSQNIRTVFSEQGLKEVLHLGSGGCGVCEKCTKADALPCRYPELAMSSLEAYGINVSRLSEATGMNYTNGENTVTYFGAVLFSI